ncbi:MAG: fold metallo-hydrolase [Flaviaesturariibacter sp.]|nr:fold metallo-hydrolase [Flaviaesturariibacter sp.]
MQRRVFLRNTALLAGAGLLFQKQAAARFFRTSEYNIRMLTSRAGIFTERGGTIGFLVTDDGIVAIDAQFPDTAQHFIDEAKKKSEKSVAYLLNTHHHGDHTAGNIAFKGIVSHVLAHENSLANQKAVAEKANNLDKQLLPDITFRDETKLKIGKAKIKGYYFGAGHTNGDAVYHLEDEGLVHMGDLLFNRRHPFVDRPGGASMVSWTGVLDKIAAKFGKDTTYIFGHAGTGYDVTGKQADLVAFRDYLQRVLDFANAEIKAGRTKEDFLKNTSIPGVTEWTGDGIQRPLAAAWDELTSK